MIEIDELEYKSLKLDKECLLSLLDYKEQKIETLKSKLENFETIQRGKCCECKNEAIQELSDMHFKTRPFEDDYFNGLTYKDIAELAKKSIRLTAENRRLEEEIEKLKSQLMQKSECDTWFNTPIVGWDNDPCKICECKQNYQAKEQECEELKIQVCRCSEGWGKAECEKNLYQQIEQEKQEENFNLEMQVSKYEQALDEIEKTANKNFTHTSWKEYEEQLMQILDIINKAKEK